MKSIRNLGIVITFVTASIVAATPAVAEAVSPQPQVIFNQDVPSVTKTNPLVVYGAFSVQLTNVPADSQGTVTFVPTKDRTVSALGPFVVLPQENCVCSFTFNESGQPYLVDDVEYRAVVVIGDKTYRSVRFVPDYIS